MDPIVIVLLELICAKFEI